jgi:elongation factor P
LASSQIVAAGNLVAGVTIDLDGQPVQVLDCQESEAGDAGGSVRVVMRNQLSGSTCVRVVPADYQLRPIDVRRRLARYDSRTGDALRFDVQECKTQITLDAESLGDYVNYLRPGMEVVLLEFAEHPSDVEMPLIVDLAIAETKAISDASGMICAVQAAVLEGGMLTVIPTQLDVGALIRIDTRTGEYVGRANR